MNFWTIFITGLTTGGLSCLAMQGGILISTLANQKEEEIKNFKSNLFSKNKGKYINQNYFKTADSLNWMPVTMFLLGKLLSHTIFGFFLGFLGSRLELSLTTRLIFQGIAAFFMFATALNLLEIHPIFRYLVIKPPKLFNRFIRSSTKSKAIYAPFIIGFLTLLIPCGVTQSMEVLSIASGNPFLGAFIMFVFVLGTSPLFALLGLGIAKLSEFWNKSFLKITAYSLICLSLTSLNGILVVIDAPLTYDKVKTAILYPGGKIENFSASQFKSFADQQELLISVVRSGYSPNRLQVKSGIPVAFTIKTENSYSCANDFIFPEFGIHTRLSPNDQQTFSFTPQKSGSYIFSCSMGMYRGVLEVI